MTRTNSAAGTTPEPLLNCTYNALRRNLNESLSSSRDVKDKAFEYGCFVATRRMVQPAPTLPPISAASSMESSYQHAFFAQSDAPRACDQRFAVKPIRGRRPEATVSRIIEQSGTTMADFCSTTKDAFPKPIDLVDREPFRVPKSQQPKTTTLHFPSSLERTRVRGK